MLLPHNTPLDRLRWFLRACTARSAQGFPFLSVCTDLMNFNNKYVNLGADYVVKLDPIVQGLLMSAAQLLQGLKPHRSRLGPEDREHWTWAEMKLGMGLTFARFAAESMRRRGVGGAGFGDHEAGVEGDWDPTERLRAAHAQLAARAGGEEYQDTSTPGMRCALPGCVGGVHLKACTACKQVPLHPPLPLSQPTQRLLVRDC